MIEKWVIFKRDYLEISFLRENCGYDGSDERRRYHECYEHSHGHIVPTNSDLSTMYILRFEKNCMFSTQIYI